MFGNSVSHLARCMNKEFTTNRDGFLCCTSFTKYALSWVSLNDKTRSCRNERWR